MQANEVIAIIRNEVRNEKHWGLNFISINAFETYLNNLERDIGNAPTAGNRKHELDIERFKAVITFADATLKSAMLINGGAVVAILAFIGNIASKGVLAPSLITFITVSMASFASGVLAAVMAGYDSFVTQYAYYQTKSDAGDSAYKRTILFVFLSFGLFILGVYFAYLAFSTGEFLVRTYESKS